MVCFSFAGTVTDIMENCKDTTTNVQGNIFICNRNIFLQNFHVPNITIHGIQKYPKLIKKSEKILHVQ